MSETILEVSIASFENGTAKSKKLESGKKPSTAWHSLFLSSDNRMVLFVKNVSRQAVHIQSNHGAHALIASEENSESKNSTTFCLDFGTLLTREKMLGIHLDVKLENNPQAEWNTTVLEGEQVQDDGSKRFFYLAITPKQDVVLEKGESLEIKLSSIIPKGQPRNSYLSMHVKNLAVPGHTQKPALDQTEFLIPLRSVYYDDVWPLEYGLTGDGVFYITENGEFKNKLVFFIINTGADIAFDPRSNSKLRITLHGLETTKNSEFLTGDGIKKPLDNHTGAWDFSLANPWKSGESMEFTLEAETSERQEGIGNLRIEYYNIPLYRDGYITIPISKKKQTRHEGPVYFKENTNHEGKARFNDTSQFKGPTYGLVPPGAIMPYYSKKTDKNFENGLGTTGTIYEGWALCDGRNGTPDLRGRFIVGWEDDRGRIHGHSDEKYREVGHLGGQKTHQLQGSEIPAHRHSIKLSTSWNGSHRHYLNTWQNGGDANKEKGWRLRTHEKTWRSYKNDTIHNAGKHQHKIEGTTGIEGKGQPHENRPPFCVLAYIMKLDDPVKVTRTKMLERENDKGSKFELSPAGYTLNDIKRIKKIIIKSVEIVDSIDLIWETYEGTEVESLYKAGGNSGGEAKSIELAEDEFIKKIKCDLRNCSDKSGLWISNFIIYTNKNERAPYGPYGSKGQANNPTKTFDVGAGKNELISFHGRHGKYVSGLGLITRTKRNT